MEHSGEKIFHRSPSGSPQHQVPVVEPFFAMTWIAVHCLVMPSLPFFVTASHFSFDRYDPVIMGD
jgi:hypothetical protein